MESTKQYHPRLEVESLTRYLPFAKYVDFLCNGLFCPKVSLFEDPWEGHVFHGISAQPENRRSIAALMNNAKNWVYASCWHAAKHESYAMWKIYGQYSDAIAIHTSVTKLKELMASNYQRQGDPVALLTTVEYVSPSDETLPKLDAETIYSVSYPILKDEEVLRWLNIMQTCFGLKPPEYAYEDEVRLLILDRGAPKFLEQTKISNKSDKVGRYIPIDNYNDFLSGVTISPNAGRWFVRLLEQVNEKFGLERVAVRQSTIFNGPTT